VLDALADAATNSTEACCYLGGGQDVVQGGTGYFVFFRGEIDTLKVRRSFYYYRWCTHTRMLLLVSMRFHALVRG
jgi:hypothetical protein